MLLGVGFPHTDTPHRTDVTATTAQETVRCMVSNVCPIASLSSNKQPRGIIKTPSGWELQIFSGAWPGCPQRGQLTERSLSPKHGEFVFCLLAPLPHWPLGLGVCKLHFPDSLPIWLSGQLHQQGALEVYQERVKGLPGVFSSGWHCSSRTTGQQGFSVQLLGQSQATPLPPSAVHP